MGWKDVQKRLSTFSIEAEASAIINSTSDQLAELQRDQWKIGKGHDGNNIGKYRSQKYARAKFQLNSKAGYGNVDVTVTGRLGRMVKFSVASGVVFMRSDDSKYDKIDKQYPNAFGLNSIFIRQYQGDTLLPALQRNFRQKVLQ